jgi:hypothetical protein
MALAPHQVHVVDQEEEMKILIELFTKEVTQSHQDDDSCKAEVERSLKLNALSNVSNRVQTTTNAHVLPPPSPFVRRKKSSRQAPRGPLFIEVDMVPKASSNQVVGPREDYKAGKSDAVDEYNDVLGFLMGL